MGSITAIATKTLFTLKHYTGWNHYNVNNVFVVHPEHDYKSIEMREEESCDTYIYGTLQIILLMTFTREIN